jgi:hypothetical protein
VFHVELRVLELGRLIVILLAVPLVVVLVGLSVALIRARLADWSKSERLAPRPHLCQNCGYDLRATADPDGPLRYRCSECGTMNEPPARRAFFYRGTLIPARRGPNYRKKSVAK